MNNDVLIVNVGFSYVDDSFKTRKNDETQFDLTVSDFVSMANELVELFNCFCNENRFVMPQIEYIEED